MQMHANPIRRVVNLLQLMQQKIEKEAASDKKLCEKFMCVSGAKQLSDDVEEAKVKIPQLESGIEEAVAEQTQLKSDLKQHKADRTETKEAMEEATAIREKEAADFAKYKSEAETNIAAMGKAIGAIRKGLGAAFFADISC
jgi:chromosome segregation ATPase